MKKDFFSEIHDEEESPLIRSIREKMSGNSDLEFKINEDDSPLVQSIKRKLNTKGKSTDSSVSGLKENVNTLYDEVKFNGSQGHGFAAERANDLYDRMQLKDAKIEGDNNFKDGADRLVDGVSIQSKYCKTGAGCINACFRDGEFRYFKDGKPMVIEVPSDKYEAALTAMQKRIKNGEVKGVTNPLDAEKYVQKGHFTYEQAKNIAKAGTIESLTYDSVNSLINNGSAFGTGALIGFSRACWNGKDIKEASKEALLEGIETGGKSFIKSVCASQLNKSGLDGALKGTTDVIAKNLPKEVSSTLVNVFRDEVSDKAVKTAASKILRGNAISGIANFAVMSAPDIINAFRGKITCKELSENLAKNGVSVAGGTAGWIAGSAAGAKIGATVGSLVGPLGTVAGGAVGFAGGMIGSYLGSKVAETTANTAIDTIKDTVSEENISVENMSEVPVIGEGDLDTVINSIEDKLVDLSTDYVLNETEVEKVIDRIKDKIETMDIMSLAEICLSDNKIQAIADILLPEVETVTKEREHISDDMIYESLADVIQKVTKEVK
ncbi:hypothetical protein [Megamonas hypermegale]|uniref:hypothetical protein n=1 Tax=Megamonas hypermegale TaxID=158847 RepID=UPI0025A4296A|nr:hypothetical protein [Megamonas hypermegale]MDM8144243.1 hypothetical protein [Megamonas hypermegale]